MIDPNDIDERGVHKSCSCDDCMFWSMAVSGLLLVLILLGCWIFA